MSLAAEPVLTASLAMKTILLETTLSKKIEIADSDDLNLKKQLLNRFDYKLAPDH